MLAFSKDTSVKPSEVYVLQFADKPAALSFANSNSKFTNTQGRTVLAIDNSPSIDPVAATAKPYTLLILGWDPTRRLNLDTSGTRVIASRQWSLPLRTRSPRWAANSNAHCYPN